MTIRVSVAALATTAVLALAACELETPPQSTPAPRAQNAVMPAAQPAAPAPNTRFTDSNSRTTTTVQGNTTTTETTSSSVSVDAGGVLGALFGGAAPAATPARPAANTAADYTGTWNVAYDGDERCTMTLAAPRNGTGTIRATGCFGSLFSTNRWSLRGNELVLADAFGNTQASLRATARNRLDGGGIVMWR